MTGRAKKKNSIVSKHLPELRKGNRLGKYRLAKRLGVGGYCEVWKARDTNKNQSAQSFICRPSIRPIL